MSNKKVDYIIPMEKSLGADTATNLLLKVIIPGISEPPVRTLRATIPENERHIFR